MHRAAPRSSVLGRRGAGGAEVLPGGLGTHCQMCDQRCHPACFQSTAVAGEAERQGRMEKGLQKRPMKPQLLNGLFPVALFVPLFCPGH